MVNIHRILGSIRKLSEYKKYLKFNFLIIITFVSSVFCIMKWIPMVNNDYLMYYTGRLFSEQSIKSCIVVT